VHLLIHEGERAAVTVHDATDDVEHNTFDTWFSSCSSSLDKVGKTEHLDTANKANYHARR
jgi:hypothetical protein